MLSLAQVSSFKRLDVEVVNICLNLSLRSFQEMSVGYANGIRVMSMTHTGEPGFMLYIPIEVRYS